MTGALFAVLAFGWLNAAARSWTNKVSHWMIVVAIGVALLFVLFAVTSFRRARQL